MRSDRAARVAFAAHSLRSKGLAPQSAWRPRRVGARTARAVSGRRAVSARHVLTGPRWLAQAHANYGLPIGRLPHVQQRRFVRVRAAYYMSCAAAIVGAADMPFGRGGDALDGDVRLRLRLWLEPALCGGCRASGVECLRHRSHMLLAHPRHRRRRGDQHTLGEVEKSHPWPWPSPPIPTATNTRSWSIATASSPRFKLPRRVGFTDVIQRNPTGKGPNECCATSSRSTHLSSQGSRP